jgi:hypothetical protein
LGFPFARRTVALLGLGGLAATPALAKDTEMELGLSGLEYTRTQTKGELDDASVETDDTELRTLDPNLTLEVFANKLWLGADMSFGQDATSGTLGAGYAVAPNVYVGGILSIDNAKSKSETDAANSESTSEDNTLAIGPVALYRVKTSKTLLEAAGYLAYLNGKIADDTSTQKFQVILMQLGGQYYWEIVDRFLAGVGGSFSFSLQGKYKLESDSGDADGDYKRSSLSIQPLNLKYEI